MAKQAQAEYEWVQHVAIGRLVGVTDQQIAAIERAAVDSDPAFDELERVVLVFASEVLAGPRVSDQTFSAVSDRLPPRQVVELMLTIGQYLMLARVMIPLELELDSAAGDQVMKGVGGT